MPNPKPPECPWPKMHAIIDLGDGQLVTRDRGTGRLDLWCVYPVHGVTREVRRAIIDGRLAEWVCELPANYLHFPDDWR